MRGCATTRGCNKPSLAAFHSTGIRARVMMSLMTAVAFPFTVTPAPGGASFRRAGIDFFDTASADHGVFTDGGIDFHNNSTAANGTFTLGQGSGGGRITF